MSCYVHSDAGACIDYTRIMLSVPCRTLCLELTFVFTVSMYDRFKIRKKSVGIKFNMLYYSHAIPV